MSPQQQWTANGSDSAVPRAQVKITNLDNAAVRATATGSDRGHVFTNVPAGHHNLEVTKRAVASAQDPRIQQLALKLAL
jgi:hypothetical protein